MAVVREIEPWDELLAAGREDERLVMQAAKNRRRAREVALPDELHPEVADALKARGVERLWSHQAAALHAAWAGPTIVTTGTASGKSLCFQLPTLDTLCRDARARALYLYPTKALAQDQARSLQALGVKRARPAIYDGDTPREQRAPARQRHPHQPGHAAPRDPPEPPRLGRRVRQPRGRRDRRGARLSRRVRLARRERAAATAPDRGRVRDRAALPARQRHDRQPGRARRAADRAAGCRGDRRGRLAGSAQDRRDVEPADRG